MLGRPIECDILLPGDMFVLSHKDIRMLHVCVLDEYIVLEPKGRYHIPARKASLRS